MRSSEEEGDAMARIATFDDWVDLFKQWRGDIGVDHPLVRQYQFETKFGEIKTDEMSFGTFKGQKKWETVAQIPDQRIRDALLNLIVYQGDTEFASVEQQRNLFAEAPNEYDLKSLGKIMCEEMRHGWQMSYLLAKYFGTTGKIEAQKLLERRAFKGNRLLGSFNEDVKNWLDFFIYTQFVDRDGKFQLTMLSFSGFAPLGRSMVAMLKEEAYHVSTGNFGLTRIVQTGKIPTEIIQRYLNRWVPTAFDLFGNDHSSSAHWAYVWGLKGRFDEDTVTTPADLERLNETAREHYHRECQTLLDKINTYVSAGQPPLRLPDIKFRRSIGDYVGKTYSVDGALLSPEEYERHLTEVLPRPEDEARLEGIFREGNWIVVPSRPGSSS